MGDSVNLSEVFKQLSILLNSILSLFTWLLWCLNNVASRTFGRQHLWVDMKGTVNLHIVPIHTWAIYLYSGFQAISFQAGWRADAVLPSPTLCRPWVESRSLGGQACWRRYLHDKEEEDDDDDVDLWVDPHSRPAQGLRVTYVFYPRIVVKEGADGFTRHQLGEEEAKGSVLQGCSVLPLLRELIPSPIFQGSLLLFSQGRILPSGKSTCAQKPKDFCAVSSFLCIHVPA